jgi:hypothetical protein
MSWSSSHCLIHYTATLHYTILLIHYFTNTTSTTILTSKPVVPSHWPCRCHCHPCRCRHRPCRRPCCRRHRHHRHPRCRRRPRRHRYRRSPPRTSQRSPPHPRRPLTHPSPRAQRARRPRCMSTPLQQSPRNRLSCQTMPGERRGPATPRTQRRTPPPSTRNRRSPPREESARASACRWSGATNFRPSCSCPWWSRREESKQQAAVRCVKMSVNQAHYL